MSQNKRLNDNKSNQEVLAWAEFLYDEYMLSKHKQLLLGTQPTKIEKDKGVTGE